jgi:hypothetical protein
VDRARRQAIGAYGAHVSWSNTPDRTRRTAPARRNSPASVDYWLDRLPDSFRDASEAQRLAAAESARRAHFARLSLRSAQSRRRKGGNRAA